MSYHYANGPIGYPGAPAGPLQGQGQMPGPMAAQAGMQQPAAGIGAHGAGGQYAMPGVYGPSGSGYGYDAGYPAYAPHAQAQQQKPFFHFSNDRFLKGVLIGAAAAYLLTNESVQRNVIKGAVKAWSMVQGSVAELKERFGDAEAELRAEQAATEQGSRPGER